MKIPKLIFTGLLFAGITFSCTEATKTEVKQETNSKKSEQPKEDKVVVEKAESDSVLLPEFTIQLDLSEKATAKLKEMNETVIVNAWFLGDPVDKTDPQYIKEGHITFGEKTIELVYPEKAVFNNVKIAKSDLDRLIDPNYQVLINVYSGRKSSENNLLSCDMLQEPIETLKGGAYILKGKLIEE